MSFASEYLMQLQAFAAVSPLPRIRALHLPPTRQLENCRRAHRFAMVGPSAGCLPDALFSRGVTLQGGSWITDRAGFIEALHAGKSHSGFSV